MAISQAGSVVHGFGTSTAQVVLPAVGAAGDLVVLYAAANNTSVSNPTVTGNPTVYTYLAHHDSADGGYSFAANLYWFRLVAGTLTPTVSVSYTNGGGLLAVILKGALDPALYFASNGAQAGASSHKEATHTTLSSYRMSTPVLSCQPGDVVLGFASAVSLRAAYAGNLTPEVLDVHDNGYASLYAGRYNVPSASNVSNVVDMTSQSLTDTSSRGGAVAWRIPPDPNYVDPARRTHQMLM